MKPCPKDRSIRCADKCKNCHRFPRGKEAMIIDSWIAWETCKENQK